MPTTPPPLNGLRHLAIVVEDLESVERFYVEVMGMKLLNRASPNLVYLTFGNDNLSIARKAGAQAQGGGMDHFGFIVDSKEDLESWFTYLQEQGADLLDSPHDHSDGARSFHVKDPAGNIVQPIFHPAISGQRFEGP